MQNDKKSLLNTMIRVQAFQFELLCEANTFLYLCINRNCRHIHANHIVAVFID